MTSRIYEAFVEKEVIKLDGTLNEAKIKPILEKLKPSLISYINIQKCVKVINVEKNIDFQNAFSRFYRINPRRNINWKTKFFSLFQSCKEKPKEFQEILIYLKSETGKIEASFASKLIATLDTSFPVLDSNVLKNLSYDKDYNKGRKSSDRIGKIIIPLYNKLIEEYKLFLQMESSEHIIKCFKDEFPETKISYVKIIDFILWKM